MAIGVIPAVMGIPAGMPPESDRVDAAELNDLGDPSAGEPAAADDDANDDADDDAAAAREVRDRLRRRATFLYERAEARELRRRVAPRRSRREQIHAALRMRTFRT
jgi:hypothetical protein